MSFLSLLLLALVIITIAVLELSVKPRFDKTSDGYLIIWYNDDNGTRIFKKLFRI